MYILLILFSAFLTYQLCNLEKQYSKTEKINIAVNSFIVSTILNHLALYAYFGNMSLVYLENNITTLLMDTPYNKDSNITRVHNWEEIYEFITEHTKN